MSIEGGKFPKTITEIKADIARTEQVMKDDEALARPERGVGLSLDSIAAKKRYGAAKAKLQLQIKELQKMQRLQPDFDITAPEVQPDPAETSYIPLQTQENHKAKMVEVLPENIIDQTPPNPDVNLIVAHESTTPKAEVPEPKPLPENVEKNEICVRDHRSVMVTTTSGSRYIIQKMTSGYTVAKMLQNSSQIDARYPAVSIDENTVIKRNEKLYYGSKSYTGPVKEWTAI